MSDDSGVKRSDQEENIKSFQLVTKMIADQQLEIETIRVFLRERGVTNEDYDLVKGEIKRRWDASSDVVIEAIKERRAAERLRKLVESADGPKQ